MGHRGSFHGERGVSSNMQQTHAAGVRLWIPKEYQLTPPVRRRPNFQSHEPREPCPSSRSERCHSLTGCRVSPRATSPIPDPFRPPFPRTTQVSLPHMDAEPPSSDAADFDTTRERGVLVEEGLEGPRGPDRRGHAVGARHLKQRRRARGHFRTAALHTCSVQRRSQVPGQCLLLLLF